MAQISGRKAAVKEGRLEDRPAGKGAVDPGGIDPASGLPLEILIAADMVRVGMRVVNRGQMPFVGIEDLPQLSPRVLVVAAVDQADIAVIQADQADLRRTLDIIIPLGNLNQFIHRFPPPVTDLEEMPAIRRPRALLSGICMTHLERIIRISCLSRRRPRRPPAGRPQQCTRWWGCRRRSRSSDRPERRP